MEKKPKSPSTDEWIDRSWYSCIMEYFLSNKTWTTDNATAWMYLSNFAEKNKPDPFITKEEYTLQDSIL